MTITTLQQHQPAVDSVPADPFASLLASADINVTPLREIDRPDASVIRDLLLGRPAAVVLRGAARDWPQLTEWAPERLRRDYGETMVRYLRNLPSQGVTMPQDQRQYETESSLAEFLDAVFAATADQPCYLAYLRADTLLREGVAQLSELSQHLPGSTDTRLWMGSAGTRSLLHSDLKDNLFCQVWGRKAIVVADWEEYPNLYPFRSNLVNSRLDLADLDRRKFPRVRKAALHHCVVEPGDVVYMPSGTWHDIRSLSPALSVNHWFGRPKSPIEYTKALARMGPSYWGAAAGSFVRSGLLGRAEGTRFFFSPPSTGKRLFDWLFRGDFSRENDPAMDDDTGKSGAEKDN